MDKNTAAELIDSVFTFDDVGAEMMALRKSVDDKDLQKKLADALLEAALDSADDSSDAAKETLAVAAEERVAQYVTSTKSTKGTGCGR